MLKNERQKKVAERKSDLMFPHALSLIRQSG